MNTLRSSSAVFQNQTEQVSNPPNSASGVHPAEIIQSTKTCNQEKIKYFMASNIWGSQMPIRLQMEQTILSQFSRPGLSNEFIGLQTVLGLDEEFQYEDYLNDPTYSVEHGMGVHEVMERKLGLGVNKLRLA